MAACAAPLPNRTVVMYRQPAGWQHHMSYALSTIAASLAMSGWLRADVICDAFSTISPQTETNTKRNKNVFVRATINVKWSPKQAPGPTVRNAPSSAESLFEKGP